MPHKGSPRLNDGLGAREIDAPAETGRTQHYIPGAAPVDVFGVRATSENDGAVRCSDDAVGTENESRAGISFAIQAQLPLDDESSSGTGINPGLQRAGEY